MKTIKFENGAKAWYFNGVLHRADGPARVWPSGTKEWYLNGKRHRVDGPARVWPNGSKQWWLNNVWIFALEPIGDYIVIEEGLPSTMEWLGKPVPTLKVLTAEGICFIPNLPGI
jgi:hypothetical protein